MSYTQFLLPVIIKYKYFGIGSLYKVGLHGFYEICWNYRKLIEYNVLTEFDDTETFIHSASTY
jgi:hypothetical protein